MLTCLPACNAGLNLKPTVIEVETKTVIIPERIPEDLFEPADCPEKDEIKWSDAREASEHYRDCKDLANERIRALKITTDGRWKWLEDQAKGIKEDNEKVLDALDKNKK